MICIRRLLALLVLSCPALLRAAPGDLDTTFGAGTGWVSTGFAETRVNIEGMDVLWQADGKLVVAGFSWGSGNNDALLARYNADGTLDTTFGDDGWITTAMLGTGANDYAYSVIQQTDGKLVVAGFTYNNVSDSDDFMLLRYNTDGTLDIGFDGDGAVITTMGLYDDKAYSVIQQTDGKLVVAGYNWNGSQNEFALARYNSNGTLDTTFSGDGKLTTAAGLYFDYAYSVIQQADGKLVAAGYSYSAATGNDFALVRYNANGSLDTSFNGTGKVITAIGADNDYAYSVIQQADGKLVVAGYSWNGSDNEFALVRYNTDGTLDTGFDGDGKLATTINASWDVANDVIQQPDGKLVVAGGSGGDLALVRYNVDGSLDPAFDGDGKVATAIGTDWDIARSITRQPDGKLVVAGSTNDGSNYNFALVRYNADGSLDTALSDDGRVITGMGGGSVDSGRSVILQSDGRLVVVGHSWNGSDGDVALARYNADGLLDGSFDGDGKLVTVIGIDDEITGGIQQSDGKLVVAGRSQNGSDNDFVLARYNADGLLDTTFNSVGKFTTAIGSGDDIAYSIIQQADDKLVVAGASHNGSNHDFALVRYNLDGSLDTTFDGDGMLTTAIGTSGDVAYSVIQQADGKLVAAGLGYNGSNYDFALVRYNIDGSLDASFDGDGKLITAIGPGEDRAFSIIQAADGRLVVAGITYNGSKHDVVLVRYNIDGSLDTTFNGTGKLTTTIGTGTDYGYSVIQQSDGRLVVAGSSWNGSNYDIALLRCNPNGSLDATFGAAGKLVLSIGSANDEVYSVIQQADGKLVVAGYSQNMPTGQEFVAARFESGQLDTDGDGLIDWLDTDNDGDGVLNAVDAFPLDAAESVDTDGDAIGNNADLDDDNDGVPDYIDAEPLNPANSSEIVLPLDGSFHGSVVQEVQEAVLP